MQESFNPLRIIIVMRRMMMTVLMMMPMVADMVMMMTVCCRERRRQGRLWCKGLEQVCCGTGLVDKHWSWGWQLRIIIMLIHPTRQTWRFSEILCNPLTRYFKRSKNKKPISLKSFLWAFDQFPCKEYNEKAQCNAFILWQSCGFYV